MKGFFGIRYNNYSPASQIGKQASVEFLHQHQCQACPLNHQAGLLHPKMEATGSDNPLVYVLGEAPGEVEDETGRQMVGPAGEVLRFRLPRRWLSKIRWNNCVRTRPPGNRDPSHVELECCRPSVERDIETTRPKVVMGFGNVPLNWAVKRSGVTRWTGRKIPMRIGSHTFWFFPIVHPSYVLRSRVFDPRKQSEYGSEVEFAFALDVDRALKFASSLPEEGWEPVVHTEEDAEAGIEWVTGSGGWDDVYEIEDFLARAAKKKSAGFDLETKGIRPYEDDSKILTVAVSTSKSALAFPLRHREAKWTRKQLAAVEAALIRFIIHSECIKCVHNLAFELEHLAYHYGPEIIRASSWGDSYGQAYVLDERQGAHSLGDLCLEHFGLDLKPISKVDVRDLDNEPLDKVLSYNGMDAKYHRLVYLRQNKMLRREGLLQKYLEHLERIPTAVLTQMKGLPIDRDEVDRLLGKYTRRMEKWESQLKKLAVVKTFEKRTGSTFKPGAPDDVKFILNRILKMNVDSTDKSTLAEVDNAFSDLMLKWRAASKLYSTYIKPIADSEKVFPDGMLHPQTKVNTTRTSRTASDDPNYQNWPKRGEAGSIEIRGMVKPGPGDRVVSFDYSGMQAKNVAMESLDPGLVEAFWNEYDIHTDWSERLVDLYSGWIDEGMKAFVNDKDVRKKYRQRSKNEYVFPSLFGAQPKSKARSLGVPIKITEQMDEEFWDRFGGVKSWHEGVHANYFKMGYVTGRSGYRRRAPVEMNERINSPIQGDEAELVMDAMTRLSKIDYDVFQASMEIHDDLTFIWPKKKVDEYAETVIKTMLTPSFAWARVVPIAIEMSEGEDWANQEDVGEYFSNKYPGLDMPRTMEEGLRCATN